MAEQEFCRDCTQKHDCKKVYEQLGDVKGPSVVVEVILAFLLPLVLFIAFLAAFGEIFAGATDSQPAQTALSLLPALLVTSGCVLIMRAINRRLNKGG